MILNVEREIFNQSFLLICRLKDRAIIAILTATPGVQRSRQMKHPVGTLISENHSETLIKAKGMIVSIFC